MGNPTSMGHASTTLSSLCPALYYGQNHHWTLCIYSGEVSYWSQPRVVKAELDGMVYATYVVFQSAHLHGLQVMFEKRARRRMGSSREIFQFVVRTKLDALAFQRWCVVHYIVVWSSQLQRSPHGYRVYLSMGIPSCEELATPCIVQSSQIHLQLGLPRSRCFPTLTH